MLLRKKSYRHRKIDVREEFVTRRLVLQTSQMV